MFKPKLVDLRPRWDLVVPQPQERGGRRGRSLPRDFTDEVPMEFTAPPLPPQLEERLEPCSYGGSIRQVCVLHQLATDFNEGPWPDSLRLHLPEPV
jgi:hypothetical protein